METESALPHLLQAEQGCPPEDCGGPSGAVYWASVWHDKAHEEHDIALDMFGRHEPGWLDVAALQKAVQKLQLKPRKKSISTPKETISSQNFRALALHLGFEADGQEVSDVLSKTYGSNGDTIRIDFHPMNALITHKPRDLR